MARSFVSVRFADLPNLRYFSHNGNAYQKRSSRTAYLLEYDRVFNFSRGERVEPITAPIKNGMTPEQVRTAADHFIIAALWADKPEGSNPRASAEARETARRFVYAFAERYPRTVAAILACDGYGSHPDAGSPAAALGHDIYLTCAGHGAGFSDRAELGDLGDRIHGFIVRDWRTWYVDCEFYRGWLYVRAPGCKQIAGEPNDGE